MVSKNKIYLYITYFSLIDTKKKNNLYHTIAYPHIRVSMTTCVQVTGKIFMYAVLVKILTK